MTKKNSITIVQLNNVVSRLPNLEGMSTNVKQWIRVDVGTFETYLGDNTYIISVLPPSSEDCCSDVTCQELAIKATVTNYLYNEGFITSKYVFAGVRRQTPPSSGDKETSVCG